ncbi:VOC family protein [Limosilactobacillus caccae]|jgi:catechol 2,3-dioxygenase-like lactoylglutathione lyase family enzyme|uniref:VOC family protein n=1 Tax=Limosilactobacillus caccae TaxID=1926284 RepID=UPI000970736F|nr:VOC family protein [Limosilactobacillus caccae]
MAFNKSLAGYFDDVQHIGIPTDDMPKTIAFWEKLGFKKLGEFDTDDQGNEVVFMHYAHLTLEIWTGDGAVHKTGAINHISLNTSDADAAFKAAKEEGFTLKDSEVQHLDFWDKGIKFFNIEGPNSETIEFCEIVK